MSPGRKVLLIVVFVLVVAVCIGGTVEVGGPLWLGVVLGITVAMVALGVAVRAATKTPDKPTVAPDVTIMNSDGSYTEVYYHRKGE